MNDVLDPLDRTIAHLHTSVRLANVLEKAVREPSSRASKDGLPGPHTVRDLTQWSEHDLLRLPHMGKRLLRELIGLLEQEGASLRDPEALIVHTHTDQTLRATNTVLTALGALSIAAQIRVLKATCTVLDIDVELLQERKIRDVR